MEDSQSLEVLLTLSLSLYLSLSIYLFEDGLKQCDGFDESLNLFDTIHMVIN